MEVKMYNQEGKEAGKMKLSDAVFNLPWNGDLVHQVLVSLQANARIPYAHTKGRGAVRGGGKKPWRQKGTGRARHGSNRSPIWIGGGVTHGPNKEENYTKKINAKMKTKALLTVLSAKLRDNEILFVEGLSFEEPKANKAKSLVVAWENILQNENILSKKKNSVKILIPGGDANTMLSFRNFKNIAVSSLQNANLLDILSHKYLVITNPKESVEFLEGKVK